LKGRYLKFCLLLKGRNLKFYLPVKGRNRKILPPLAGEVRKSEEATGFSSLPTRNEVSIFLLPPHQREVTIFNSFPFTGSHHI
jgi:hypothetical protein